MHYQTIGWTGLFLLLSLSVKAQKYTVSGYVKDAASGESLNGANVFDKNSLSGISSNAYGFYSLTLPRYGGIRYC